MNVGSLLTRSAKTFPDHLAIARGSQQLTYARFNARANQLANVLQERQDKRGTNVGILMYNSVEMLEAMFACFKAGLGAVPINFRLHPKEFAFIIDHSQAETVLISPHFNDSITKIRDQIPGAHHLITTSAAQGELEDYETLISSQSEEFEDIDVQPDELAWLFYTSGTTGRPKGAMLTHRNLLSMTMNFYADMCPGYGFSEVTLHAAPLSHGSGLYALPNVGKAAAHILPDSESFDPEQVLELIERHSVTNLFAAPAMVKRIVDSPQVDQYDHRSLKAVIYGGAPMLVEDLTKAIEKLGPCLVQLYGQGESPMTITYLPHQDHVLAGTPDQMKRLASAGIAHSDVEVAIFDQHDQALPTGSMGEIVTRSDLVMKGYWRDPEATAQTLRNGWLHTGDMGYIDDKGYVFLMDRTKDLIISGGENIYPREIEEVIIQHPAVREVAVIGVPDKQWGESVKAVVSLNSGHTVTASKLIEFCKGHIASFKKPKTIDFVDELPKNNYGKVVKRVLKDQYWGNQPRQVV